MPVPKTVEARRYFRVALQRLEDAEHLADDRPAAAVYLAGDAVECILKSLILCHVPVGQHAYYIQTHLRGPLAHDLDWLRARLHQLHGAPFPREVLNDLTLVSTWSVDMRCTPGLGHPREAQAFIKAVQRVTAFVEGRLN